MTHRQATHEYRMPPGMPPSDCPGWLADFGQVVQYTHASGRMVEQTVRIWQCHACSTYLAIAGQVVQNSYRLGKPGDLIRDLAHSSALPDRPQDSE